MGIKRLAPEDAKRLIDEDGYAYVDVRSIPEYSQSHAQGATNVPIMHMAAGGLQPNPDFLPVMEANYAKDAKLVLGCKSGARSMRAATELEAAGYTDLVNLEGGFEGRYDGGALAQAGWSSSGLPVTTETPDGASYEALAAKTT